MNQPKTCTQCGAQIDAEANFCPYCGFKNASAPTVQTQDGMQGRPSPGSYRPPKVKRKSPIGIAILIIFLIVGGTYVYKSGINQGDSNGGTSPVANLIDFIKGDSYDLNAPESYLPAPNLSMTYYEMYMDGGEGPIDLVTANIISNVIVSDATMYTDGTGQVYAGVCHYFQKSDGSIYFVFDEDPTCSYPVLPGIIQPGVSWVYSTEYGDVIYSIQQVGATCTLECGTFEDCLVVVQENQAFGTSEIAYFAPGMGVVLRQSVPDGASLYRLASYQQIDAGEAQSILLTYSYNHEQVNSQLGGQ